MKKRKVIIVNNLMQKNYRYELVEPIGKNFSLDFNPELNPKEILEMGVFGGRYMRDCQEEFPKSWFSKAKFHKLGLPGHNPSLNFFGVDASQSLSIWREKGWIKKQDPRGWFQWYCRYYMGRRSEDDERQIRRFKMMRRHILQIKNNCKMNDLSCRKKQRQALLHWAYDSRKV